MPLPNNPLLPTQPIIVRQVKPPPKRRFRWGLLLTLLVIVAIAWIARSVKPAVRWEDVAGSIGVHDQGRARMLVCLGLVAVAICVIARIARRERKKDE
jgi:hypothetical protein